MEAHKEVTEQIEKIRYIFQHALFFSSQNENLDVLAGHLENVDLEFRSIAYEGVAMGLALKDLSKGTLHLWRSFMRTCSSEYAPHIHVGLGWAISKQKLPSLLFVETIEPLMRARILDGCGYYDGTFKQIQTVTNYKRSVIIEKKDFHAYDQGVGRSLWYICKGESDKVANMVQAFPPSRQPDLWRGIGIACTYVGGSKESTLKEILHLAAENKIQLAIGAALAIKARAQMNSLTKDSELVCRVWFNLSEKDVTLIAINAEPPSSIKNQEGAYEAWLFRIGLGLSDPIKLSTVSLN